MGPSGPETSTPPSMEPVIGEPTSVAAPSAPPPGTPGRGPTAKGDKSHGKGQIGTKLDENSDNANATKAPGKGKSDPKNPGENGKPAKKPGNDKPGKGKGINKSHYDDLFTPVSQAFNFYGGMGDNDLMETGDMDTDGEENPNPKKRKNQPIPEPPSSEEDEPAKDPVLINNLISATNEANARSRELEQIVQGQEAKLRLLARAASIKNITLAQELTEEQIAEAQGEISWRIWFLRFHKKKKQNPNQIQKQESLLKAQALQNQSIPQQQWDTRWQKQQ